MVKKFLIAALAAAGLTGSLAHADATLVYETTGAGGNKTQHTFSITKRFVRVDSSDQQRYALIDTGRMVMFNVDDAARSFTPVRVDPRSWPRARPILELRPEKKRQEVAGHPLQPGAGDHQLRSGGRALSGGNRSPGTDHS